MTRLILPVLTILFFLIFSCENAKPPSTQSLLEGLDKLPQIAGTEAYLTSPYVTAGDRVYAVGFQDGSFPDFGWHIPGEMGGVWNHPIKLMDGFIVSIQTNKNEKPIVLSKADQFINYPLANRFSYRLSQEQLAIERIQFSPDALEGLIVELNITNQASSAQNLQLNFTTLVDLMPVWLSDSLGITDGEDEIRWNGSQLIAKDKDNPWFLVIGSNQPDMRFQETDSPTQERKGLGKDAQLILNLTINVGETLPVQFYIAGSYQSEKKAQATYRQISENPEALLQAKWARYQQFLASANIIVPDEKLMELHEWLRYNSDWLIRDVPEQGRGLSAGIADFPWWFGADNCYALQGLLSLGWHEEVKQTMALILKLSRDVNDNGRIMHEASTNGVVFNKGNLNETPHFIYLMWDYLRWTGDVAFIEENFDWVEKGLHWLLEVQDKDGNMYPDGEGMMEIAGLHSEMIDVVVYTQQALEAAAKMASILKKDSLSLEYQEKANQLKIKINNEWWVAADASYADFRATPSEAMALIKAAMVRADTIDKPWAKKDLEQKLSEVNKQSAMGTQSYVVHHNWVVNTPLEMKLAPKEIADMALETARKYTNKFGVYVTGMDRDENASGTEKWSSFSYVGAVMTLPTGVQAVAEAQYGNPDQALQYMQMLHNSFSYALPGGMYEVSPDYGQMVQAWNIYGHAVPLVNHFFGFQPLAHKKELLIKPNFPSKWNEAVISQVKVGNNAIDFSMRMEDGVTYYTILQNRPNWKIYLDPVETKSQTVYINEQKFDLSSPEQRNPILVRFNN